MPQENKVSDSRSSRVIINSSLLLLGALTLYELLSGKEEKSSRKTHSFDPKVPVPCLPGHSPHESPTFHQLRLSRGQYENLRKCAKVLVFQFYYPQETKCGAPTLLAYAMKKHHQSTGKTPEVLGYDKASKEPINGRSQVLGDLQVKTNKIDDLIERVTKSKKGNFYDLIFTPIYLDKNPHMTFEVSVDGSSDSVRCDPSPPYSAA